MKKYTYISLAKILISTQLLHTIDQYKASLFSCIVIMKIINSTQQQHNDENQQQQLKQKQNSDTPPQPRLSDSPMTDRIFY